MTGRLRWSSGVAGPSVAVLLDEVRDLIVQAREHGEEPTELVVDPPTLQALEETKHEELARHHHLLVYGLRVVRPPALIALRAVDSGPSHR